MALAPSDGLLLGALQSLAEALAIIDREGRVAYLNPRAELYFGLRAGECVGARAEDLYRQLAAHAPNPDEVVAQFRAATARAAEMPRVTFAIRSPRERAIEAEWFALRGDAGQYLGQGILFRDVTRDHELDQMKNQLLSTVSHELRTPLASIKGFTSTLLRQDVRWDEATQRDFLKIIEEETDRLGELIDNLLDMSQIEAGALRVHKEPVHLRNLVREAVERVRPQTESHWFVVDLPSELPRVWADPRRIRQVLHNLLENAIKYSPRGGQITISCEVDGDQVVVSVADQGEGISPEHLDRIFDQFFQVDSASTRKTGGSGLGLSISKSIIEAHGGKLWAESQAGQGSIFRFTLPLATEAQVNELT